MCKFAEHAEGPGAITVDSVSSPANLSFIPNNSICQKAYALASSHLPPSILNHSIRVFLYAEHIASLPLPSAFDSFAWSRHARETQETLLFIAALFHDIGVCDAFDGDERFEVCGADAAVKFMLEQDMSGSMREEVWTAIACHTSAGIAENIAPVARIVRLAVLCDFKRVDVRESVGVLGMVGQVEGRWLRGEIERELGDMVVDQIARREGREREKKAPRNTWPGALWRGSVEMKERGVKGVNVYF